MFHHNRIQILVQILAQPTLLWIFRCYLERRVWRSKPTWFRALFGQEGVEILSTLHSVRYPVTPLTWHISMFPNLDLHGLLQMMGCHWQDALIVRRLTHEEEDNFPLRRSVLDHDFLHRFLLSRFGRNLLLQLTLFLWYRGNHYPCSFPHLRFHLESREFVRRGKFIFEECTIVRNMCESRIFEFPIISARLIDENMVAM